MLFDSTTPLRKLHPHLHKNTSSPTAIHGFRQEKQRKFAKYVSWYCVYYCIVPNYQQIQIHHACYTVYPTKDINLSLKFFTTYSLYSYAYSVGWVGHNFMILKITLSRHPRSNIVTPPPAAYTHLCLFSILWGHSANCKGEKNDFLFLSPTNPTSL